MDKEYLVSKFLQDKLEQFKKNVVIDSLTKSDELIDNHEAIEENSNYTNVFLENNDLNKTNTVKDSISTDDSINAESKNNILSKNSVNLQPSTIMIITSQMGIVVRFSDLIENNDNIVVVFSVGQNNFFISPCNVNLFYKKDNDSEVKTISVYCGSTFSYADKVFMIFNKNK